MVPHSITVFFFFCGFCESPEHLWSEIVQITSVFLVLNSKAIPDKFLSIPCQFLFHLSLLAWSHCSYICSSCRPSSSRRRSETERPSKHRLMLNDWTVVKFSCNAINRFINFLGNSHSFELKIVLAAIANVKWQQSFVIETHFEFFVRKIFLFRDLGI